MKYIGIRGHRGAGKKSVTYLLGNTIEYLIMKEKNQNNIKTSFDDAYNTWVQHIMDDESIYSLESSPASHTQLPSAAAMV